jgi:hypothetical protein
MSIIYTNKINLPNQIGDINVWLWICEKDKQHNIDVINQLI